MSSELYYCTACKRTFPYPDVEGDPHSHNWRHVCPLCGSTDYERMSICVKCGRPQRVADLRAGKVCTDCLDEAVNTKNVREFLYGDRGERFAAFLLGKWGL